MLTFSPSSTLRHLALVSLSMTHPSETKLIPSKVAFTASPVTALMMVAGLASLLFLVLGLRKKSAPPVGAKFSELLMTTRRALLSVVSPDMNDMLAGKSELSSVSTSRSKTSVPTTEFCTFCTLSAKSRSPVSRFDRAKVMSVESALGLYIA